MVQNVTVHYSSRNATLLQGWVPQPEGRGSIDILWSCAFTVFLSSWSTLCLNLPAEQDGWWKRAFRKFYWMLLTVMGPEIIFQLALGEWLLARRWTKQYKQDGFIDWTMTHTFYANMGGFKLSTPDHGQFPVNAAQLHYLLTKGYIDLPAMDRNKIQDKNKAEAIVRYLTLGQIIWFFANCVARLQQGLALTTIELSTLAFTFSAMGSFYCWYHKPMDVEVPDILELIITIESIHQQALGRNDDTWIRTPLDFVDREREWPWNIYWQCGVTIMDTFAQTLRIPWIVLRPRCRPVERFPDDYWPAPTFKSLPALFVFHVGYAAILMAGWNLDLPTNTELLLWRISTSIQLGTIVSGWLTMPLMMKDAPKSLQRLFAFVQQGGEKIKQESTIIKTSAVRNWYGANSTVEVVLSRIESTRSMVSHDPNWRVSVRLLVMYEVIWAVYFITRMYIVVEDVVSMRAMPVTAFATVDWSEYLPHL